MTEIILDPSQRVPFSDMYWASRPKEVQALKDMTDWTARKALAIDLAAQGHIIDPDIDATGAGPYDVMVLRLNHGCPWWRSIVQPMIDESAPAQTPNLPFSPYDPTKPPPGSIKSSIDPADYPPIVPPTPPPPQPGHRLVGPFNGSIWTGGPDAMIGNHPQVTNGQLVTVDATYDYLYGTIPVGTYKAVVIGGPNTLPGAWIVWFIKTA